MSSRQTRTSSSSGKEPPPPPPRSPEVESSSSPSSRFARDSAKAHTASASGNAVPKAGTGKGVMQDTRYRVDSGSSVEEGSNRSTSNRSRRHLTKHSPSTSTGTSGSSPLKGSRKTATKDQGKNTDGTNSRWTTTDVTSPMNSRVSHVFGDYEKQLQSNFSIVQQKHREMQEISERLDNHFEDLKPSYEFSNPTEFLSNFPKAFGEDAEVLENMQTEMESMEKAMTNVHDITRAAAEQIKNTMESEREKRDSTKFMARLSQKIDSAAHFKFSGQNSTPSAAQKNKTRRITTTGYGYSHVNLGDKPPIDGRNSSLKQNANGSNNYSGVSPQQTQHKPAENPHHLFE